MRTKQGHVGPVVFSTLPPYGHLSLRELPLVNGHPLLKDPLSVRRGDMSVGFYGGIVLWKLRPFLRVFHLHCHHSGPSVSFCESNNLVGVISSLSHLFISLNFFIKCIAKWIWIPIRLIEVIIRSFTITHSHSAQHVINIRFLEGCEKWKRKKKIRESNKLWNWIQLGAIICNPIATKLRWRNDRFFASICKYI